MYPVPSYNLLCVSAGKTALVSALVSGAALGEQEHGRGLRVLQCVATPVGEARAVAGHWP